MTNENKKPIRSRTKEVQIRNILYKVTSHFKEDARENALDKWVKYVSNQIIEARKRGEDLE